MEKSPQLFDVCIVCALPEEVRAFLEVVQPRCEEGFEEHSSPRHGYSYRSATLRNDKDEPLILHVSWQPRYEPQEMTLHISRVLEECQPRIAIMTGICAGDAQRVQLGDIVVAERTFTYDNGTFVSDEQGRRSHELDTMTYQLDANIKQFLELFDDWKTPITFLKRPSDLLNTSFKRREVRCHIKPMASGSAVRADNPFEEVQAPVRGTVAIDMEGAAFGIVMSRHLSTPWLIVKGVCDYADQNKDNVYHDYASRASALYALSFIQAYVTNERLPRHAGFSPSSRAGPSEIRNVAQTKKSVEVIFCYARKDQGFLLELKEHLSLLQREKRVTLWADIDIDTGREWDREIRHHLDTAQMILLLISPSFIASDYCYSVEMQQALERHEHGEAHVIPIIVRPVEGRQSGPFGKLQVLPRNAKPISLWAVSDEAYHSVVEGVRKVVDKIEESEGRIPDSDQTVGKKTSSFPITPASHKRNHPVHRTRSFWFLTITSLGVLLVLLALILPPQFHAVIPSISLKDANISGWMFVREQIQGAPNVLEAFNPRTGELHLLWPNKQELQSPTISAHLTDYYGPNYSPATHLLTFLATDVNGHRSIWLSQVTLDPDGWPAFSNVPVPLINPCDTCGELAWSPSGKWLIFAGRDGLYAISTLTHERHRITFSPQDAWPACSPDGKWLAYQGLYHTIQAVPTADCLPISSSITQARFVYGFSYAWHPMWSLDGKEIIFSSNITSDWILYRVAFRDMSPSYTPDQRIPYTRAGAYNCGALAWARRQSTGQEIILFTCKDAKPKPDTHGCSLLIQPAILPPDWEVMVSAGTALWDDVDWMPPVSMEEVPTVGE